MNKLNSTLEMFGITPKDSHPGELGATMPVAMLVDGHRYFIGIGKDEIVWPHFHVFKSESDMLKFQNGASISLTSNRYIKHFMHREILTEKEIDILNKYLGKKYIDTDSTNWQRLVELWNNNNLQQVKYGQRMPTYNKNIR